MLYAEDLPVGRSFQLGEYALTEAELRAFATRYDPLPIHIDPAAAARGPFGGLIASGLNTLSIYQRLISDALWRDAAVLAGRGIQEVRFLRPVRPGDTLSGRSTIVGCQLRSERGNGLIDVQTVLWNQNGDEVLSLVLQCIVHAAPPSEG